MFYKVLILELLVIGGLVTLRVRQNAEEGPTTTASQVDLPASEVAVTPLPDRPLRPVTNAVEGRFTFPVAGHGPQHVISVFGDKRGSSRKHKGIDIKAPRGTQVVATTDGFIERVREGGSGGKQVYLRDGRGRLYYYAHLDSWEVEEFAAVEAGDVLGTVGDTGNAKGTTPHLHFEVLLGKKKEAIDPLPLFLAAAK